MSKIGVYGGAFNPPHLGHMRAVENAVAELGLDKVLLVPTGEPPHKVFDEHTPSPELRLKMLELAAAEIAEAEVSDIEFSRQGPSYTVDTLRELTGLYPEAELYLLLGSDMLLSFDKWRSPAEICRLARLVSFFRRKDDEKNEQNFRDYVEGLRSSYGAEIYLLRNDYIEISSTDLRRLIIFGGADSYLKPEVLELILRRGLYHADTDFTRLSGDELRQSLSIFVDESRLRHTLGCEKEALRLAKRWGARPDLASRAALLHDITKALGLSEQLILCKRYGIMNDTFEERNPKLLHAKTGAAVAKAVFGAEDEIVQAIYWHTTGRADMSLLEKIIYLADYIEPGRGFERLDELRRLAYSDLDAALLCGLNMSINELASEGRAIHPDSCRARQWLADSRQADGKGGQGLGGCRP